MKYKRGDLVRRIHIADERGVILNVGNNLYRIKWTNYGFLRWHQEQDICLVQSVRGNK